MHTSSLSHGQACSLYLKLLQVVIAQRNILLELGVVLLQLRVVLLSLLVQLTQAAHLQQQQQLVFDATAKQQGALRLLCKHWMCPTCHIYTCVSAFNSRCCCCPTQVCSCTNTSGNTNKKTVSCPSRATNGRDLDVRRVSVDACRHLHACIATELKESEAVSCNNFNHLCGIFTNLFLGLRLLILQLAHEGC